MNVTAQIAAYINSQPEAKRQDMYALHQLMSEILPEGQLWFLDGKNSEQKTVANPNIGYGWQTLSYADGSSKAFYQIGISANTSGISVYILGLQDKAYLAQTYGQTIGKASVTGYCIKFKKLDDVHLDQLEAAIRYGLEQTR